MFEKIFLTFWIEFVSGPDDPNIYYEVVRFEDDLIFYFVNVRL